MGTLISVLEPSIETGAFLAEVDLVADCPEEAGAFYYYTGAAGAGVAAAGLASSFLGSVALGA